jgi:hypothetical protein
MKKYQWLVHTPNGGDSVCPISNDEQPNTGLRVDGVWAWDEKNHCGTIASEWHDPSNYRPATKNQSVRA